MNFEKFLVIRKGSPYVSYIKNARGDFNEFFEELKIELEIFRNSFGSGLVAKMTDSVPQTPVLRTPIHFRCF